MANSGSNLNVPGLAAAAVCPGAGGAYITNNGGFAGTCVREFAGVYALTLNQAVDPGRCNVTITPDGGSAGRYAISRRVNMAATPPVLRVFMFDDAGAAADHDFGVSVETW